MLLLTQINSFKVWGEITLFKIQYFNFRLTIQPSFNNLNPELKQLIKINKPSSVKPKKKYFYFRFISGEQYSDNFARYFDVRNSCRDRSHPRHRDHGGDRSTSNLLETRTCSRSSHHLVKISSTNLFEISFYLIFDECLNSEKSKKIGTVSLANFLNKIFHLLTTITFKQ